MTVVGAPAALSLLSAPTLDLRPLRAVVEVPPTTNGAVLPGTTWPLQTGKVAEHSLQVRISPESLLQGSSGRRQVEQRLDDEALAASIRAALRSRGWIQDELAGRMQAAGVDWTRVIAGYAENVGRNIAIDEFAALAIVFETTPGYFLAPPAEQFELGTPLIEAGDHELPGAWLVASAAAGDAAPSLLDRV